MTSEAKIYIPKDVALSDPESSGGKGLNIGQGRFITKTGGGLWYKLAKSEFFGKKKVTRDEVISFTRELATLLESGVSIGRSLELLAAQRTGEPLAPIIDQVGEDLVAGATLSEAFARHPEVFDEGYIRSIGSASKGAPVARSLYRAAEFMSDRASIMSELRRQLTYPVLVMAIGLVIVGILLTVSLPQMVNLFTSLESELPLPTQILISISNTLRGYPEYIALSLLVVVIGSIRFMKSDSGRKFIHRATLKIPMIKKIVLYNDMSRLSEVMSSLLESGLPINNALDVAKDAVSNDVVREALVKVGNQLVAGEGIAQPLRKTGLFPSTFTQSLEVAENTGSLNETLARLSKLYREEARTNIKSMVGLVQPLSTIFVALAVGFIAISVIMPMYTALGQFE